jgi:hypothetical protein
MIIPLKGKNKKKKEDELSLGAFYLFTFFFNVVLG